MSRMVAAWWSLRLGLKTNDKHSGQEEPGVGVKGVLVRVSGCGRCCFCLGLFGFVAEGWFEVSGECFLCPLGERLTEAGEVLFTLMWTIFVSAPPQRWAQLPQGSLDVWCKEQ